MTFRKAKLNRVLWAVDPYSRDVELTQKTTQAVRNLLRGLTTEVEPVYVLVPNRIDPLASVSGLLWNKEYLQSAKEKLEKFKKETDLPHLSDPKVLVNEDGSIGSAIDILISHAKKQKAEAIFLASHARKGMDRFFMGSFAETLVLKSPIPVVVVNPRTESTPAKKVFFATDLSSECRETYDEALAYARSVGASITLFHQIGVDEAILIANSALDFDSNSKIGRAIQNEYETKLKKLKKWAEAGKAHGVEVEVLISKSGRPFAEQLLNDLKEKNADLLMVTSQVGPTKAVLVGSHTRQLLRAAEIPVWVLRTDPEGSPFEFSKEEIAEISSGHFQIMNTVF